MFGNVCVPNVFGLYWFELEHGHVLACCRLCDRGAMSQPGDMSLDIYLSK